MERITSNPLEVRGLGNICKKYDETDYCPIKCKISRGEEYIGDLELTLPTYSLSNTENNIEITSEITGDLIQSIGNARIKFCVKNEEDNVENATIRLYIDDEIIEDKTTNSLGETYFDLDSSKYGLHHYTARVTNGSNQEYLYNKGEYIIFRKCSATYVRNDKIGAWVVTVKSDDTGEPIDKVTVNRIRKIYCNGGLTQTDNWSAVTDSKGVATIYDPQIDSQPFPCENKTFNYSWSATKDEHYIQI